MKLNVSMTVVILRPYKPPEKEELYIKIYKNFQILKLTYLEFSLLIDSLWLKINIFFNDGLSDG